MIAEVIFSNEYFQLVKKTWGKNDETKYEGLEIISLGNADKHVVEIRLYTDNLFATPDDNKSLKYKYIPDNTTISHGMRMKSDTFAETQEYIDVLQSALEFAKRVNQYIIENDWT